tara:strand:+ start:14 stop:1489 length:1476 start_codon:yes stop_codon:yes gene_type:complete
MASIKSYSSSAPNLVGATTGGETPQQGLRRRHNFGDRMYKLSPEETPFFAYLSAVGKAPTDDPVFRVLEDRAPTKWADRSFQIVAQSSAHAGDAITLESDVQGNWKHTPNSGSATSNLPVSAAAAAELLEGMLVQAVSLSNGSNTGDNPGAASSEQPYQITGRISAAPVVNGASSYVQVQTVDNSNGADVVHDGIGGMSVQVIGSAFGEGTGAPASFGYDMDDTYGYTQIFKTSAHMSNTARATVLRGYASEWDRIWSLKLREHKVDIERAMLFNNKGRDATGGITYTDGIIGNIIKSGVTWQSTDATDLAYEAKKPYIRVVDLDDSGNEAVYDRFLDDFEIIFAPERGGASDKFCMASMSVVTYLNKLKGGFMDGSTNSRYTYNLDFSAADGGLGHKVMKIDTVHGSLSVVKNPLLKGIGSSMMVGVDLGCVAYRPLVGNGLNRDTYIETNVQSPEMDARQDLILTEAGLEVCLPETHFLYQFVSDGKTI